MAFSIYLYRFGLPQRIILDRLVLDDYFEELLHGMTGATFAYTKCGSYKPAG